MPLRLLTRSFCVWVGFLLTTATVSLAGGGGAGYEGGGNDCLALGVETVGVSGTTVGVAGTGGSGGRPAEGGGEEVGGGGVAVLDVGKEMGSL